MGFWCKVKQSLLCMVRLQRTDLQGEIRKNQPIMFILRQYAKCFYRVDKKKKKCSQPLSSISFAISKWLCSFLL